MSRLLTFFFAFLLTTCAAQPQPPTATSLLRPVAPAKLGFEKEGVGSVKAYKGLEEKTVLRLTTITRPSNIYNLSRSIPLKKTGLGTGRVLLLSFEAKTEQASLETGEGKLLCLVKQGTSHKHNLSRTASIGVGWRTYSFPFTLTEDVAAGDLALVFQFGFPEQEVLVRGINLALYPEGTRAEALPRTQITYAGRGVNAEWRRAAAARIERHRKGSFSLRVLDENGKPQPNVDVSVKLQRHYFGWGAAVNAKKVAEEPERLDRIAAAFNTVVFENDLKIKRWGNAAAQEATLKVMDQLKARGVGIKGHVLIWPGLRYLSPEIRQVKGDAAKTRSLLQAHVNNVLERTAGRVSHWDVVNEAYSNRYLQEVTGSEEILYDGFRTMAKEYPSVGRFTNEFGIISRGGHDETKQKWYYDYIKRIDKNTGGLVEGIGIQCHMGSDLTSPKKVLELLNYYGELNKKISISEFTIDLDDKELRFDYTRDFLTLAFSHPAVSEFLFWGYDERSHPKAAILDAKGKPADMGSAYYALVHGAWKTEVKAATDLGGRIQGRGFYGTYSYTFMLDGELKQGTFELSPDTAVVLDLR
jgi:GH35 family endo-1,4-beta-xylanase